MFLFLYHPAKKIVPYDTGTNSNIQTKQIELSNGKKVDVAAHQIMAKIENQDTVKSFGNSIQTTNKKDVYIITVKTDDLLAAGRVIRQKPGVVWTTPRLQSDLNQ
jgi:hypothetical protein